MVEFPVADQKLLNRLREIILDNLGNESFGIKELAKASGISTYRLNRKLKSIKRQTIHQFILETRLQKALEILKNEDITASEVAYKTGFSNPAHFNASFHKFFGYSPGKVRSMISTSDGETIEVEDDRMKNRQRLPWQTISIAAGIVLSFLIIVYLALDARNKISPESSIAVLPFRNLSNDSTDQFVYDGIMEEIFNNLVKVKELRVISHTSVEQFRNTDIPVKEIGKDLDVNFILEGSGQKIGTRSMLRIQLIQVSTDSHIWTGSYELDFRGTGTEDLFRQTSQIAQAIASELGATITPEELELIDKVPTQDLAAYKLYQKANIYRMDYEKSREISSYQTAINLYNAAIEIDTVFAKAYTGLALLWWNRYYDVTYFNDDFLDTCLNLADKALEIDDDLDEAYFIKGRYFAERGQHEEALANYDLALKINPNYALAYMYRGNLLAFILYDYVKSLDNFHKALELTRENDRAYILSYLGNLYMNSGFPDRASYYLEELLRLTGDSVKFLSCLCWLEFSRGNLEGAINCAIRANQLDSTFLGELLIYNLAPGHMDAAYAHALKIADYYKRSGRLNLEAYRIGYVFWLTGKHQEAEFYYAQHIKNSEENIRLNRQQDQLKFAQYDLACIYAVKGDTAKAFRYLSEYCNRSYSRPIEIYLIKNDPMFANIRKDERFINLVRKMEIRYQAEHERVEKWLKKQTTL